MTIGLFGSAAHLKASIKTFKSIAHGEAQGVDIRVEVARAPSSNAIVLPEVLDADTLVITVAVGLAKGEVYTFMDIPYAEEIRAGSAMIAVRTPGMSNAVSANNKRTILDVMYDCHQELRVVPRSTYDQVDRGGEGTWGSHVFPIAAGKWAIGLQLSAWLTLACAVTLSAVLLVSELRRRIRIGRGCCVTCGYSLDGLDAEGVCPECGTDTSVSCHVP